MNSIWKRINLYCTLWNTLLFSLWFFHFIMNILHYMDFFLIRTNWWMPKDFLQDFQWNYLKKLFSMLARPKHNILLSFDFWSATHFHSTISIIINNINKIKNEMFMRFSWMRISYFYFCEKLPGSKRAKGALIHQKHSRNINSSSSPFFEPSHIFRTFITFRRTRIIHHERINIYNTSRWNTILNFLQRKKKYI